MLATLTTRRRCPYCGASIELGACPIVATGFEGAEFIHDENFDTKTIELPSGAHFEHTLPKTRWPIVAPPARQREVKAAPPRSRRSRLEEAFRPQGDSSVAGSRLPPLLSDDVRSEDVPRRACPTCESPLPQSIDRRPAVVIAVVGVNRVGKTHLLAASLTQAYRQRGLAIIGCTEFVPDDSTSSRFMEAYYVPLFRHREILGPTNLDEEARYHPLVFDVTLEGVDPFSLVMHDVAGEVLGDHRLRARGASYLRAARGIIFVVDPRDIDALRDGLPDWMLESNELGGWDQGALLAACVKPDVLADGGGLVPMAVTVTKADLLEMACAEQPSFLSPSSPPSYEAFIEHIRTSSRDVEAFLERYGAYNILGPAREYDKRLRGSTDVRAGRVTYHAVSALGSAPDVDEQLTERVRPVNCLDPLATILTQITAKA